MNLPSEAPPEDVVSAAKDMFRAPRGELAVLVYDSLVDSDAEPAAHQLRFENPAMVIVLDITTGPEGTAIAGRVSEPAVKAALQFMDADVAMLSAVEEGSFRFVPVPHGLVRLSIDGPGSHPRIWTDWFRV